MVAGKRTTPQIADRHSTCPFPTHSMAFLRSHTSVISARFPQISGPNDSCLGGRALVRIGAACLPSERLQSSSQGASTRSQTVATVSRSSVCYPSISGPSPASTATLLLVVLRRRFCNNAGRSCRRCPCRVEFLAIALGMTPRRRTRRRPYQFRTGSPRLGKAALAADFADYCHRTYSSSASYAPAHARSISISSRRVSIFLKKSSTMREIMVVAGVLSGLFSSSTTLA